MFDGVVLETQFVENYSVNQGLNDDAPLKVRYFKTFLINPQMAVPCYCKKCTSSTRKWEETAV